MKENSKERMKANKLDLLRRRCMDDSAHLWSRRCEEETKMTEDEVELTS